MHQGDAFNASSAALSSLSHAFYSGGQAALLTRRGIFVNNLFIGDTIDRAHRFLKHCSGGSFVASGNGFTDSFNGRTKSRAKTGVVRIKLDSLARALASRGDIGHAKIPDFFGKALNYSP
jgi:hypothetical protein